MLRNRRIRERKGRGVDETKKIIREYFKVCSNNHEDYDLDLHWKSNQLAMIELHSEDDNDKE